MEVTTTTSNHKNDELITLIKSQMTEKNEENEELFINDNIMKFTKNIEFMKLSIEYKKLNIEKEKITLINRLIPMCKNVEEIHNLLDKIFNSNIKNNKEQNKNTSQKTTTEVKEAVEDDYAAFVSEKIIKTGNPKDKIRKNELKQEFDKWFQESQGSRKIPKGVELYEYMNKKYGTYAATGWHCINIIYPQEEEY
jgi:hypothetical protein